MADLLYRLGKLSAKRPWLVIISWIVLLALAVGGFAAFSTPLSASVNIPGTKASEVLDTLAEELPEFSGGSGIVLFTSDDGEPLTDEQREGITEVASGAQSVAHVTDVVDPFETEAQLDEQRQQVEDGPAQIEAGRAEIAAGQTQLDVARAELVAGLEQLEAGQAELDGAREQLEAFGQPTDMLDAQQTIIDEQRAEIETGSEQIEAGQQELDEALVALEDGERDLQLGAELMALADGIRTVSEDGTTAIVNLSFDLPAIELAAEDKQAIIDYFEANPVDGVSMSVSQEIAQSIPQIFGVGEAIGLLIAAIVLVVMLGTILAATFPLITAITGVGVGVAGSLAFSGLVDMSSVTPVLGVMLGLAVGIDYSLFILNRHRKQLRSGLEVHESIGLANGTSGNAVVFAGATVVIALIALNVSGIPFLGVMGTVGAACVAIAVLLSITMTPALLGLAGTRILSKKDRAARETPVATPEVRPMSTARAILTSIATIAVLGVMAIPALDMRVGLPDGASEPAGEYANTTYNLALEKFGEGQNGTLLVTADLPEATTEGTLLEAQLDVARIIGAEASVAAVAPIGASETLTLTAFQVIPAEGPTSESTEQLVKDLRDLDLGVASQAAMNIDISQNLQEALPLYLAVVVGLSLLIMIGVFRSILVPLIATGGFVLSLFATYGATVAVFQWGWGAEQLGIHPGPLLSFLPTILVGILFGLAMDYQLFIASGMREAFAHGSPARLAVMQGFRSGRAVVTAAGLIMISVFGGFIFSEMTMIRSIGFGLAFGVLVDAFIVRMLLMPALMHLVGRGAWWLPKWLDRLIPNIDVEGSALERRSQTNTRVS